MVAILRARPSYDGSWSEVNPAGMVGGATTGKPVATPFQGQFRGTTATKAGAPPIWGGAGRGPRLPQINCSKASTPCRACDPLGARGRLTRKWVNSRMGAPAACSNTAPGRGLEGGRDRELRCGSRRLNLGPLRHDPRFDRLLQQQASLGGLARAHSPGQTDPFRFTDLRQRASAGPPGRRWGFPGP
jgi:hypothetical protein